MQRPGGAPPDEIRPASGAKRVEALGARVGSGASWMMVAVAMAKAGSFASNVVLGWVLLQKDFGIFAAAMGLASVVGVFRAAGIRQVVVQKGAARYAKLEGPTFWFGSALCGGAGSLLAIAAYPLQLLYGKPVAPILIVLGIGLAMSALPAVYHSKLGVDLRFRRMAEIQIVSAIARFGSMIAFALMGFGAMSLALPWIVSSVAESAYGYAVTGRTPWRGRARLRLWPAFMSRVSRILIGNAGIALTRQGTYLVLGALETSRILGVYFFAFQLIDQINQLLGASLQQVLLPAMSKLSAEHGRHTAAVLRATRVTMATGVLIALGTASTIGPTEEIIWRFKWVESVPVVQVMALFFPMRLLYGVYNSAMISKGEYKVWARTLVLQGAGALVVAGIAGWYSNEPWVFAMASGVYFATVVISMMTASLRRIGVPVRDLLGVMLPCWAIGLAALNVSMWLDVEVVAPALLRRSLPAPGDVDWHALSAAAIRLVALGGVFTVVYLALLRVLRPVDLREMIRSSPARVQGRLMRAAMIREVPGRAGAAG